MKSRHDNRAVAGIIAGVVILVAAIFFFCGMAARAEGWGRGAWGRGGTQQASSGDSLAAFYDYGYIPNAAVPGQLLNFGQPKVIASSAWSKMATVSSTTGYPCGILTDLWLNPAPDSDSVGWSQQQRSFHLVMWEIMLISFDRGIADTLTKRMAGDKTLVGGGVPYGAWLGSMIWPRESYDNGLAQVTSVLAWSAGAYSRTLVARLHDLGIEYTDSVQVWIRPATEPWQRHRLRLYGSVEHVLLPSKKLLTGRRFGIVYNSKRPWRRDLVNYIRLENAIPVESYVRQWSAFKMGSFYVPTQRPWQSAWPYADSTHSPVYGTKNFMEENLFVFVDSLPQVAYLDSILPNAANDTVWLKAPAKSWGLRPGRKYESAAPLSNAFFLRPGANRYDPLDTTLWVTTATRYDTAGGIWKYRITNTADAENEVRSRDEFVRDSAFAWLCGNPARYYTGFEDVASGYYGASRAYGSKVSVYKLLFDVGTDSAAYASWGFTANEEGLRFRSGLQISSMKCLPQNDSVSWHERSCVVYYTRDLLRGNEEIEWPVAGRCCWGPWQDWCAMVTEEKCGALAGLWDPELDCDAACDTLGACCFVEGSCAQMTRAACEEMQGVEWHAETSCEEEPCPPLGRCCLAEGGCVVTTEIMCGQYYEGISWEQDSLDCENGACDLGRCCSGEFNEVCTDTTRVGCASLQGDFLASTDCIADPCEPLGRCCYGGDQCDVTTEEGCVLLAGFSWEMGLDCYLGPCDPGRCCSGDFNEVCTDTTRAGCEFLQGEFLVSATCVSDPCEPLGRCCLANGSCAFTTEALCAEAEGVSWEPELDCGGAPCELGRCCHGLEMEDCLDTTRAGCASVWGNFMAGTDCQTNPCTEYGRCCFADGSCELLTEAECIIAEGVTWLAGADCGGDPCVLGRCCFPDYSCETLTQWECEAQQGVWDAAFNCVDNPCTTHVGFDHELIYAADTYTLPSAAANSFGGTWAAAGCSTLIVSVVSSQRRHAFAYVKMDSVFSPDSISVTTAGLCSMYTTAASTPAYVSVYRVITDWVEGKKCNYVGCPLSHNKRGWTNGDTLSVLGASIAVDDSSWPVAGNPRSGVDSTVAYDSVYVDAADEWRVWDVTALVQEWLDGTPNYGLNFHTKSTATASTYYKARDSKTTPDIRPRIRIRGYYVVRHY